MTNRQRKLETLAREVKLMHEDELTNAEIHKRIEVKLYGEGFSHTTVSSYIYALQCRNLI